jgi:hypothetical protein
MADDTNMDGFVDEMGRFTSPPPNGQAVTGHPVLSKCGGMDECGVLASADQASTAPLIQLFASAMSGVDAYCRIAKGSGGCYATGNANAAAEFVRLQEVPR